MALIQAPRRSTKPGQQSRVSDGAKWTVLTPDRQEPKQKGLQLKPQLCQDIRNGAIGRRDAQRTYRVSANLIQLGLSQFDRGELNQEEAEASVVAEYEGRIVALERKVGQLTMELDMAKKLRAILQDPSTRTHR